MTTEITPCEKEQNMKMQFHGSSGDTVYGLGLIGAWVFYIGRAKTFQQGLAGFFKGIVWPAFMVYELFVFLNKE